MNWRRWKTWLHRPATGSEQKAIEAERALRRAQAETPMIRQAAQFLAHLPDDEFAARVRNAFRG